MTNNKDNLTMLQRIEVYAENVRTLYTEAVDELLRIARKVKSLQDDEVFSFDDKKAMREQSQSVIRRLHALTVAAIEQGIELEWEEANKALDLLTTMKFGKQILNQPQFVDWFQRNTSAMQAFINRRNNGMNLSDRVWKYSNQLKSELEMALTVSIGEGNSAGTISRRVRHLLNQPDKLFRRVRDKATGNLKLSKAAQAYNPGRGIYRSSAKNAMRLARTETNMAYRNSDYTRRQQLDFVIGQKIFLSRSHPEYDICDELEGEYPKDFVFSGWHPQCFCVCTSILMSRKEMHEAYLAKKQGKEYRSKNEIKDYPKNFKDWVKEHKDDIAVWRSKNKEPYFLRENKAAIDGILKPKPKRTTKLQPAKETFADIQREFEFETSINTPELIEKAKIGYDVFASKFGCVDFKNNLNSLCQKFGLSEIQEATFRCTYNRYTEDASLRLTFYGEDWELKRSFDYDKKNNVVVCHHDYFEIPPEAQGKGFSKAVFRELYNHYKKINVNQIYVHANIDVGGYTWAKYGFSATNKFEAEKACKKSKEALQIVSDFYKDKKHRGKSFPMRLLLEKFSVEEAKNILKHSDWQGILDFDNEDAKLYFENYIKS